MPKLGYALFLLLAIALIAIGLSDRWISEDSVTTESPAVTESAPDTASPRAKDTVSLEHLGLIVKPRLADFDTMVKSRLIRALVVRSKTFFFFDGAQQRGLSYDALTAFEEYLNKQLETKTLKTHIIFIPVTRDQLIPALLAGYGDIAVGNITITPEREELVDFSAPIMRNASEILVTGPSSKPGKTWWERVL